MTEDDLYNAVIEVIETGVGARLHQFGAAPNTKPAIFKKSVAQQLGQQLYGILPYCQVVMGTRTSNGSSHHARWFNTNGDQVKQIIRDVNCTIQIVGADAADICSDLENFLLISDYSINYLCEQGIAVRGSGLGVVNQTTLLSNQSHDSAFTQVTLTTTDEVVETVYQMNAVDANLNLRYPDSEDNIVSEIITIP